MKNSKTLPPKQASQDKVRLSKRMGELGICSRREADEWIASGWVRVDGIVVDQLGSKVSPGQKIEVSKTAIGLQKQKLSILLHKPVGYVSHKTDEDYPTATSLLINENRSRLSTPGPSLNRNNTLGLAPVGRLDIDSRGLIFFTQDGRLAKQIIGETAIVEKEYVIGVRGELTEKRIDLLRHGLSLDGKELKQAKIQVLDDSTLNITLIEGKKRQIRRMCEEVGLEVISLKRIRIGKISLGDLEEGCWRYLGETESFV